MDRQTDNTDRQIVRTPCPVIQYADVAFGLPNPGSFSPTVHRFFHQSICLPVSVCLSICLLTILFKEGPFFIGGGGGEEGGRRGG